MAFKMKGSAFKLNNVATKSALKHGGAAYAAELEKSGAVTDGKRLQNFAKKHNDNFAPGHTEHTGEQNEPQPGSKEYKRRKKAEKAKKAKDDSGVKTEGLSEAMISGASGGGAKKSPAKQKTEEAKKAKQTPDISLMKKTEGAKKATKEFTKTVKQKDFEKRIGVPGSIDQIPNLEKMMKSRKAKQKLKKWSDKIIKEGQVGGPKKD